MSLAKQEFTNAGKAMLGRAQNGEVLTISQIVVGDGAATDPSVLWPLTALISPKLIVAVSAKNDFGDGTMLVEGSFTSDAASAAFYLREVGIMAHIGSEADKLYSVANVFSDPPDFIDPAAPTITAFKIKLVIDRIPTDSLVVSIGPTDAVLGENLGSDSDGHGIFNDAVANLLTFKRIAPGAGISMDEDPDTKVITISASALAANVDLYVPTTYSPLPSGALAFDTIQEAHDYLLQFRIPSDKIATIHIDDTTDGTPIQLVTPPGTGKPAILFNHPDSRQINLIGQPRIDKSLVTTSSPPAIHFFSTASKDVNCVGSNSGLHIGMPVYIAGAAAGWVGGARVTSLPLSTSARLSILNRSTRAAYNTDDIGSGRRVSYFGTRVKFNGNPNSGQSLLVCPNGIGTIQNICFEGGWYVLELYGGGIIQNCQVIGNGLASPNQTRRGLSLGTGDFALVGENVFSDCDFGLTGVGSLQAYDQTAVNGNSQGIVPSAAGFAIGSITLGQPLSIVYLSHNLYGINAVGGGHFLGGSIAFLVNLIGMQAAQLSVIVINAQSNPTLPAQNTTDLRAQGMGYIEFMNAAGTQGTLICSPGGEVVGNQNAFIHFVATP